MFRVWSNALDAIEAALIVTFPKAPEKEFQGLAPSLYFITNYHEKTSTNQALHWQIFAKIDVKNYSTLLSPLQLHYSRALLIDNSDITECCFRY